MNRRDFLRSFAACGAACAIGVGLNGCMSGKNKGGMAACGKDCSMCPAMKSGKCGGCKGDPAKLKNPDCEIRKCCMEKGLANCSECAGFPCPKLEAWAKKSEMNQKALDCLKNMKK